MPNNPTVTTRKTTRPIQVALVSSLVFLSGGFLSYDNNVHLLAQHLLITGAFFLCIWAACQLFSDGVQRRMRLEGLNTAATNGPVYSFVLYLEIVKHVVGVSFTLGWMAGVLFSWEKLGDAYILLPFAASVTISVICFMITYGLSRYVDQLRWPEESED